jgi:uncharacterized protein YjbI with pentapeptide repeats
MKFKEAKENSKDKILKNLRADCANCFGLCCVALHFSASEGFPNTKKAGKPCVNLQKDFRCSVHESLNSRGLKGCIAYECFGAGQKVSQGTFEGKDWLEFPDTKDKMFDAFLIMRQIHELLWYLEEALILKEASSLWSEIESALIETRQLSMIDKDLMLKLDLTAHWSKVNKLLLKASELVRATAINREEINQFQGKKILGTKLDLIGADLRETNLVGANLRGAYLIATDMRVCDLKGVDFIGADTRDTDFRGADLSESIFLTQAQINVTKGDAKTKLSDRLERPDHWQK